MSPSLSRIRWFASQALARQPSEWEAGTAVYGDDQNPWIDIFPPAKAAQIARIIRISDADEIHKVRLLLAHSASDVFTTYGLIGGPASDGNKRRWADKAIGDAKRLKLTLLNGKARTSTGVHLVKKGTRTVGRIVPGSSVASAASDVIVSIDRFLSLVEASTRSKVNAKHVESGSKEPTAHQVYLQYPVDRMTDVYLFLRGRDAIKRTADGSEIRGEYPDFVRAASIPVLLAYYPGFAKNEFKLNAQIQDAVSRYGSRKR